MKQKGNGVARGLKMLAILDLIIGILMVVVFLKDFAIIIVIIACTFISVIGILSVAEIISLLHKLLMKFDDK